MDGVIWGKRPHRACPPHSCRGWRIIPHELSRSRSSRRIVSVGWCLLAVGAGTSAAVLTPVVLTWLESLAQATARLGIGLAYATVSLAVLRSAPRGEEGGATAAMQLAVTLGTALGPGLGGALVATVGSGGVNLSGPLLLQFLLIAGLAGTATLLIKRLPDLSTARPSGPWAETEEHGPVGLAVRG